MRLIEEISNSTNILRNYELECLTDRKAAVTWLYHVKNIEGIKVSCYTMSDFANRSDEGSGTREFGPDAAAAMMTEYLSNNSIDTISMTGTFLSKPIVIGVDLNKKDAYIIIRKREPADVDRLEKSLREHGETGRGSFCGIQEKDGAGRC